MEGRDGRWCVQGTRLPLVVWLSLGGALVVLAVVGVALLIRRMPSSPDPTGNRDQAVVHVQQLPSGKAIRVSLHARTQKEGGGGYLARLEMSLDGASVFFPSDAYTNLPAVSLASGLAVAEAASETYLVLSGGPESDAWQVKFTIQDGRLRERIFLVGGPSEVTRYAPPPGVPDPPRSTLITTSTYINLIGPQSIPEGIRHD